MGRDDEITYHDIDGSALLIRRPHSMMTIDNHSLSRRHDRSKARYTGQEQLSLEFQPLPNQVTS